MSSVMIQHVYLISEEKDHDLEGFECSCVPRIISDENGGWIVVHKSSDGREALEEANEILNNQP